MKRQRNRTLGLTLSCALLLATSPITAAEIDLTPTGFRLHLEEAYSSEQADTAGTDVGLLDAERVIRPPVSFQLDPLAADAYLAEAAAEAQAEINATPRRGGFGRWVKKHWYVPVLVAVAIGFAVSDDSDSGEEEDD